MSLIAAKKKLLMAQKKGLRVQEVFNTSLWTGTGADRTITTGIDSGEGSLVWVKGRNVAYSNLLSDTSRGADKYLISDLAGAQGSSPSIITSFSASGYGLGNNITVNGASNTYVGWQFRRAPEFFDIVQYTGNGVAGRSIAHNLGVAPGMIIIKRLDAASDWQVYHQAQGATKYGVLNTTAAFATASNRWNNTEPTASAFTVGNDATVNSSGGTYIAYLFAYDPSPEGLIQYGSYVGNGSSTGPVVNLGWRPQYLMVKGTTTVSSWGIYDTARATNNPRNKVLFANASDAEYTDYPISFNLNGFQLDSGAFNASGATYIYMAIREA